MSKMAAPSSYQGYRISLVIFVIIGMLLAVYAYHVETSKEKDSSYRAFCDISARMSCSKAFTSKYGRGFGLLEYIVGRHHWINQPNSVFGIIFYIIQLILGEIHVVKSASLQVALSVVANLGSVYLACVLIFILDDFCIVCVTTYITNAIILLINILRYRFIKKLERRKKTKKTK